MNEASVTALGVVCPVGLTAAHAGAALLAGVSRLLPFPYFPAPPTGAAAEGVEIEPEPITAGRVALVHEEEPGPERVCQLALLALQRVVDEGRLGRADLSRTGFLLALPAADAATSTWRLGETLAAELVRRAGIPGFARAGSLETGPAGALRLLDVARSWIDGAAVERCIVLAADTYLDVPRLAALDAAWRLRSDRNPDGFLPGEAAVALLVEQPRTAARRGIEPLAVLGAVAWGSEPHHSGGEPWSSGTGLAAALSPLLGSGGAGRWTICNLNGESYRAHEWGVVQARLAGSLGPVETLWHPADAIGDAGTALAALCVAVACDALSRGHAPAPEALAWAASDDGGRTAVVVRSAS